jgi:ParB-like chromosome segregation protein Spo0J
MMIPIDRLVGHPANCNVMPADRFRKLVAHLRRSGRYPPVIVRKLPCVPGDLPGAGAGGYQVLDGHHRVAALRELGVAEVHCNVWEVDDDEALMLLATLNRLQGGDDPKKRAAIVAELASRRGLEAVAAALPENAEKLRRLVELDRRSPVPAPPPALDDMPQAVHFFLRGADRRALEATLRALGGTREAALMRMVAGA